MTFKARAIFVLTLIAGAGNAATGAPVPHNLVLFIPEALPGIVESGSAPTLIQLREEGVHFTNSHSGFPRLGTDDLTDVAPDLNVLSLVDAAAQRYATAFVYDERVAGEVGVGVELQRFLGVRLPDIQRSGRPFLFIYRLIEAKTAPPATGDIRGAYRTDPRAADAALKAIETALNSLDLATSTNIIVTGEHGLSRIMKVSNTSSARKRLPHEDTLGTLPPGFLAIDLLAAFQTEDSTYRLFDTDNSSALVYRPSGEHPKHGNAIIAGGYDPTDPYITVEAHGVYDFVFLGEYLSRKERRSAVARIVETVLEQDYVGAIFVNKSRVGRMRGALPLSRIARETGDEAVPDVVIVFAATSEGCIQPLTCISVIADTSLPEGDGIPNNFSRAGTSVFMAARGPDFLGQSIDRAPANNADLARTIVELLDLKFEPANAPKGRVLSESLSGERNRATPRARKQMIDSQAAEDGSISRMAFQSLGSEAYFDSALPSTQERMALADPKRRWHWRWPFKTLTVTISGDNP